MRLLILSNYYPPHSFGSYELQCYQICHELASRGHQIRVLTSRIGADRPGENQRHVFRELELYDEEGTEPPPFHRLFALVRSNRRILERHLETFLPEAVMVWGMDRMPTALLEIIENSGIPCLYGVYDYWLAGACENDRWSNYWNEESLTDTAVMRPILRALGLDKLVLRQAALGKIDSLRFENIYFCSESLKEETSKACGLTFPEARVVPCAVSPTEIRPRRGQQSSVSCQLVYVARLSDEKDPLTAIRAIQELRHRGDDRFSLDIYGKGTPEFEALLHDYVRRYQLGGAVSFKPAFEEQVRNRIHLYDALIFTSRYPEPFPLVHLKAMAARVPVVSTPNGGSGEVIRDGENGVTFEAGNHYELADKIIQLAEEPEFGEQLADTAYEEVTRHYSMHRISCRVETLLYQATKVEGLLEEEAV